MNIRHNAVRRLFAAGAIVAIAGSAIVAQPLSSALASPRNLPPQSIAPTSIPLTCAGGTLVVGPDEVRVGADQTLSAQLSGFEPGAAFTLFVAGSPSISGNTDDYGMASISTQLDLQGMDGEIAVFAVTPGNCAQASFIVVGARRRPQ